MNFGAGEGKQRETLRLPHFEAPTLRAPPPFWAPTLWTSLAWVGLAYVGHASSLTRKKCWFGRGVLALTKIMPVLCPCPCPHSETTHVTRRLVVQKGQQGKSPNPGKVGGERRRRVGPEGWGIRNFAPNFSLGSSHGIVAAVQGHGPPKYARWGSSGVILQCPEILLPHTTNTQKASRLLATISCH